MSGYVDHGWRHAPKSQGGTDPSPGGSGGIVFDDYNTGVWFSLTTTNDPPGTDDGLSLINMGGGPFLIRNTANPGGGLKLEDTGGAGINILASGGSPGDANISVTADGSMGLTCGDTLILDATEGMDFVVGSGGNLAMTVDQIISLDSDRIDLNSTTLTASLPTSNPGGAAGRLWNDSGTVKITL